MKRSKVKKIVSGIVFLFLVSSVIYVIIRIIMVPGGATEDSGRPESEYILMLLQCVLGIFIMFLPGIIARRISIEIPNGMHIMFTIFLFCAIYLGEVRSFFYQVKHWDVLMHAIGSGMLGALGFSFVTLLNKSENVPVNLSPLFVALFAFCFSIALGVLWEIYEFVFDGMFGLNMQKFLFADGTPLVGRAALMNTMKDLIVDVFGGLIVSAIGYVSLKYKKGWVEKVLIKKIRLKSVSRKDPDKSASM